MKPQSEHEPILDDLVYPEAARRHAYTMGLLDNLRTIADRYWRELSSRDGNAPGVPGISERACIYITGSIARLEAVPGSDLDLFVMDEIGQGVPRLNYVENSHLVSTLDRIRLDAGFRPFSRGGDFVRTHSLRALLEETGSPNDDAKNTFTARILLLINSRPLLNVSAYESARESVLDRYWRTNDPAKSMYPIMLMNDIRRWWGVLGLNFEMYTPRTPTQDSGVYTTNAKREEQNLKLRYARMLACYSVLLSLIFVSDEHGVRRSDAELVLELTPIERLTYIAARVDNTHIERLIDAVLRAYDEYLEFMRQDSTLIAKALTSATQRREVKSRAYAFHRDFCTLLDLVGRNKLLFDYLVV